jgi:ribosomal protein S18 acetylase RimI-like enzyme
MMLSTLEMRRQGFSISWKWIIVRGDKLGPKLRRKAVGRGGRFGKYGEHKRLRRLRRGRVRDFLIGRRSSPSPPQPRSGRANLRSTGGSKLVFRQANPRDVPFIAKLSREVFSVYGPYDEIIPRWASFPHIITLVVEGKGQRRGFAMINPTLGGTVPRGELLAIAVSPEYQRRGVGGRLLRHMEGLARDLGVEELLIHTAAVNQVAHRFFGSSGFNQRGFVDCYYPMGQKAVEMSKRLPKGP